MSAVIDSLGMSKRVTTASFEERSLASAPLPGVVVKQTAIERLEATRAQLRIAMVSNSKLTTTSTGAKRGTKTFVDTLRSLPGASLVVDTLLQWWSRHPLHDASVIAREASGAILRPIARENPLRLVFGALLVGALLVLLKPWRFILRSAIFAGLVPQFAAMALRRLPLSTWIGMFVNRRSRGSQTRSSDA